VERRIVVIGTSKGGLAATQTILSNLSAEFPWPIVIAQHRSKESDLNLVDFLKKLSPLTVCEPDDKEVMEKGKVYFAPADYHLLVDNGHLALSTGSPAAHARPSINLLFESAAEAYRDRTIGIILTGRSSDGASGLAAIKRLGGTVIVQDPNSAEAPEMPRSALSACEVDLILPLAEIAKFLNSLCPVAEGLRNGM
jgi:two-component system chemotaxis response regulator CheB